MVGIKVDRREIFQEEEDFWAPKPSLFSSRHLSDIEGVVAMRAAKKLFFAVARRLVTSLCLRW